MKDSNSRPKFQNFLMDCAINDHRIAVYNYADGSVIVKHERNGKNSKIQRKFKNVEAFEAWIDSLDDAFGTLRVYNRAALLYKALADLGVAGFVVEEEEEEY